MDVLGKQCAVESASGYTRDKLARLVFQRNAYVTPNKFHQMRSLVLILLVHSRPFEQFSRYSDYDFQSTSIYSTNI